MAMINDQLNISFNGEIFLNRNTGTGWIGLFFADFRLNLSLYFHQFPETTSIIFLIQENIKPFFKKFNIY